MTQIKKLCIRKFDSIEGVENFYNEFTEEVNIISKDIQIITREKSSTAFILSIEYLPKN